MKSFLLSLILFASGLGVILANDQAYFPMEVGHRWVAQVQLESPTGEKRYSLATREIVAKKKIGDHDYFEEHASIEAEKNPPSVSYRRVDDKGVHLLLKIAGKYEEVIEFPFPLSDNLNWSVRTMSYPKSCAVVGRTDVTIGEVTYPTLRIETHEGRSQTGSTIYLAKNQGSVYEVIKLGNTTLTFTLQSFTKK